MASGQSNAYSAKRASSSRHKSKGTRRSTIFSPLHVLLFLFAFRIVNALTLRTFFVPDEYYQSLEPAWQLAFGPHSGAWLTWEWRHQLRSSLHPILFAAVYRLADIWARVFAAEPATRSTILLAAPKIAQALAAAFLDFFTWRLAQRIFGPSSRIAWTTLAVSTLSPWQWFCSTRTLSNSLEASLTAAALCYWPWAWMLPQSDDEPKKPHLQQRRPATTSHVHENPPSLIISLSLAAIASILRPTNVLIWLPIALQTLSAISVRHRVSLIVTAIACGTIVAALSVGADLGYYGFLTLPQLRFLTFNIYQDLAVFYGVHRLDYYVTEGLPLLLMGLLPFALFGLFRNAEMALQKRSAKSYSLESIVLPIFTWTVLLVVIVMSLIRHKEARFIYPLLPCLHIIGAVSISTFLRRGSIWRGFIMIVILGLQFTVASYTSGVHQRGVIDVMHYLRDRHESLPTGKITTAAFLMPCHSTPWRSHLIHENIDAWALTCEPPVNMSPAERATYVDEADVFYKDVPTWLENNMEPLSQIENASINAQVKKSLQHTKKTSNDQITGINRPWPQYLVFFEQLLPEMVQYLSAGQYMLDNVLFNTQWHDDWRRQGNVVVFRLLDRSDQAK